MIKKYSWLVALLVVGMLGAGCVDLFSVPGIAVSPDGSSIVFLNGNVSFHSQGQGFTFDLSRADLSSGEATTLAAGDDQTLISAFGVNPATGDVAYITTSETAGTSIMLVKTDGTTSELVNPSSFDSISVGTMMRYSPDGSKLAYTVVQLPSDVTLNDVEREKDGLNAEQIAGIKFIAYVLDIASGNITPVSDPDTERANTLTWSPAGDKIAYTAWIDSNGDGTISTIPDIDATGEDTGDTPPPPPDISQISIYDVASGTVTPIDENALDISPAFESNSTLVFLSGDLANISQFPAIKTYDLGSGTTNVVYQPTGGAAVSLAVSPDGSQVAWIEFPDNTNSEESQPGVLYVAGADVASPRAVAELPADIDLADVPVWTPDGSSILISLTNFLTTIPDQIALSFSGAEATPEAEGGTPTQVLKVDVNSGEITPVYTGVMTNSSLVAGLIGLVSSGQLDQLFGAGS